MSSYLITGCSRGLGLEFVRQLARQDTSRVGVIFATTRGEQPPDGLQELISQHPDRIKHVKLDVLSEASVSAAASTIGDILGAEGLDVLINNAGIQQAEPDGITIGTLNRIFSTNVGAVLTVTQAFIPHLRAGKEKKIINITSTLGSIGIADKHKFIPTPSYKVAKAALNMLTVDFANSLRDEGFLVMAVSPGNCKTELGGGDAADLDLDVGVEATLRIIQQASLSDTGRFRNIYIEGNPTYDGEDPPW